MTDAEVTPIPVVRLVPGLVVPGPDASLAVNVNGATPPVWWPAGYIPAAGDAVKVLMVDGTAVVHSPVVTTQRPLTGTVAGGAANGTVPVVTDSGTLQCRYIGTAPGVGATVRLDWQSTTPWVWPGAAAVTPPPDETNPPTGPGGGGGPSASGTHQPVAIDSGSWHVNQGQWAAYYASHVIQGTYSGTTLTGAWWYGAGPQQAAGATIHAARLRLGARRRMGNYNQALTLNLYLHNQATRGAEPARISGPFGVNLAPNAGAQWVDIPTDWGQYLANNAGGIAVAGGGYGGVTGVGEDAASGQLSLDWSR